MIVASFCPSAAAVIAGATTGSILFVCIFIVVPIICCVAVCVHSRRHSSRAPHPVVTPATTAPSTTTAVIANTQPTSSGATPAGPYAFDLKGPVQNAPPAYSAVPLAVYPAQPGQVYPQGYVYPQPIPNSQQLAYAYPLQGVYLPPQAPQQGAPVQQANPLQESSFVNQQEPPPYPITVPDSSANPAQPQQ